jgi:SAM-dependent methyltransferase
VRLLWELHFDLPREGPGDDEATEHVLSLLPKRPYARILDAGCGPGMQTLCLARCLGGDITAIDTHQPFLDELERRARAEHVEHRIHTQNVPMQSLPFSESAFDLIWSEGAISCIGFERGLKLWRRFLTDDGIVVVSELSWLRTAATTDARQFWEQHYPDMSDIDGNLQRVSDAGYNPLTTYVLPPEAWWRNDYDPLERRINLLVEKYRGDEAALAELEAAREEIELFRRSYDSYGYVFYAMERVQQPPPDRKYELCRRRAGAAKPLANIEG